MVDATDSKCGQRPESYFPEPFRTGEFWTYALEQETEIDPFKQGLYRGRGWGPIRNRVANREAKRRYRERKRNAEASR